MKLPVQFVLGLLGFFSCPLSASNPLEKPIQQFQNQLTQLAPHLGNSLIAVSGKKYHFAYSGPKTTVNSQFYIGSVTKHLTVFMILTALQKQYPEHTLDELLGKKITTLFPDSKLLAQIDKPWVNNITLLDLLTHRSGLSDYISYYEQDVKQPDRLNTPINPATLFQAISFNPSKKYHYSNSNFLLAGKLLEEMQQSSFEVIFDETIKNPAGLSISYAPTAGNYFDFKNEARFSLLTPDLNHTVFIDMGNATGTGNVISTASDLTAWMSHFYKKTNPQLRAVMLANYTEDEEGNWNNLGLSTESTAFGPLIGFQGSQDSYHSFLGYLPDYDLTIVILSNNQHDFEQLMRALGEFLTDYPKTAVQVIPHE